MKELEQILQLWETATANGDSAILTTVVKTQGSSYRLPCLKADLLKKAWWLTEQGPTVCRYDTTAEGEIASDAFGLGCNGIVHVLLERIKAHCQTLMLLRQVLTQRHPAIMARVFDPPEQASQTLVLSENDPRLAQFLEGWQVFVETLTPAVRLLIFGAGQDAIPLASLAKYLGWRGSVADGRSHYTRKEKVPRSRCRHGLEEKVRLSR